MPKLRDVRTVDASYAASAPTSTTIRQPIRKPAAVVFRILEDGPAWKEWLGIDVEWTSPKPFGVGTTRTITANGQTMDELFTAWEDGRRMTFCFTRATLPVLAFAEDYIVKPTGENTCELHWTYAYEWDGPVAPVTGRLFGLAFKRMGTSAVSRLAEFAESSDQFD